MFGIGTGEFFIILLVAVLVLGPEHLPKLMRTFTKVTSEVRRVSTDFQRAINLEANQEEYAEQQRKLAAEQKAAKPKKKKKAVPQPEAVQDQAPDNSPAPSISEQPQDFIAAEQVTPQTAEAKSGAST